MSARPNRSLAAVWPDPAADTALAARLAATAGFAPGPRRRRSHAPATIDAVPWAVDPATTIAAAAERTGLDLAVVVAVAVALASGIDPTDPAAAFRAVAERAGVEPPTAARVVRAMAVAAEATATLATAVVTALDGQRGRGVRPC